MQIGDSVIVILNSRTYEGERKSIGKVIGETKTSWKVKYSNGVISLFRKNDLHLRVNDSFNSSQITPYDQVEWEAYQKALLRRTLIRRLASFEWNEMETDALAEIHKQALNAKLGKALDSKLIKSLKKPRGVFNT